MEQYMPPGLDGTGALLERVRSMRSAGLRVKQVATPDTKDLTDKIAEKLHNADIGWKVQILTGRDETGRMVPQSMEDVNSRYELEFDPAKYIEHYDEYVEECEDAGHEGGHAKKKRLSAQHQGFLSDRITWFTHATTTFT